MDVRDALAVLRDKAKSDEVWDFYSRKLKSVEEDNVQLTDLLKSYLMFKMQIVTLEATCDRIYENLTESSLRGCVSSVIEILEKEVSDADL